MSTQFQVGDKVRFINENEPRASGRYGTIRKIEDGDISVQFEGWHEWWVNSEELQPAASDYGDMTPADVAEYEAKQDDEPKAPDIHDFTEAEYIYRDAVMTREVELAHRETEKLQGDLKTAHSLIQKAAQASITELQQQNVVLTARNRELEEQIEHTKSNLALILDVVADNYTLVQLGEAAFKKDFHNMADAMAYLREETENE